MITNQSITFFPQDGFFADNGAFGNHTYEQQMHALTQVGATKPRPVLVNGGTADEWALQHGMSVSSEFTEVCHKLPKFHSKYSRDRFVAIVHTVYNASDMRRQVDACIDIGFGNIGVVGDYTEAIPPYWEEQVAYIAKKNEELAKANRELVLQQRHSLRTDDAAAAGEFVVPSGDSGWYKCAQTCSDPALCSPLSPQPKHRFEVVAPLVGGPRDLDAYGANGSEWRLWLSNEISQGKVTSIPSFNSIGGGFTNDLQQGLLCEAHKQGIRVLDWDTVGSLWSDFNFVRKFKL